VRLLHFDWKNDECNITFSKYTYISLYSDLSIKEKQIVDKDKNGFRNDNTLFTISYENNNLTELGVIQIIYSNM
jgi:hypothetical protein